MRTLVIAIAIVSAPLATAAAQPAGPPPATDHTGDCARAEQLTTEAEQYKQEQVFEEAIAAYITAFNLCPAKEFRASTMFNMGLAYKLRAELPIDEPDPDRALAARQAALEDRRKALGRFRDFLAWVPQDSPTPVLRGLADEAQSYVFRLQSDIDAEEIAIADEVARRARAHEDARRAVAARARATRRRTRLHVAAGVIGGAGLGLIGVGTYYGLHARSLANELSRVDAWGPAQADQIALGERADRRMMAFTVGGSAAILVAGAVLWYAHRSPLPEAPLPSLAVGPGGVAIAGRF